DARGEGEGGAGGEVVILASDPFDVRPEAHAPGEIERHVHPEPAGHRHRIDEAGEHRPAGKAEINFPGEGEPRHPPPRITFPRLRPAPGSAPPAIAHSLEPEPIPLPARPPAV